MRRTWTSSGESGPLIAVAIHNGHDMRPELRDLTSLSDQERLREEDPYTGALAKEFANHTVVWVSRFEVDLNRPRKNAVYRRPEDAWGLEMWTSEPGEHQIADSLELYDRFYELMSTEIEAAIDVHGRFVLYDIHSYNHRRGGPEQPPDDPYGNPAVNLGTGTLPERWRPVADAFISSMSRATFRGEPLDTRENVRFKGGHLSRWVHDKYGDHGCALAIEFKKTFMDEWSGQLDRAALAELRDALAGSAIPVVAALRTA